jgi:DNA-directed RNA polymerase specialized sigma24 family protein
MIKGRPPYVYFLIATNIGSSFIFLHQITFGIASLSTHDVVTANMSKKVGRVDRVCSRAVRRAKMTMVPGNMASKRSSEEPEQDPFSFLLSRLDTDVMRAEERYLQLHRKLRRFFEWRGCRHAEEATDVTLDRVNRKLAEGAVVPNLDAYVRGVARLVDLEFQRAQGRHVPLLGDLPNCQRADEEREEELECLERCVSELSPFNQDLIRRYYTDDRESLASTLGVNLNVLRLRTCRVREKLENCILTCLGRSVA